MNQKENILGHEKISKLLLKFSVPCIISLLVNSLYNIVDQIFIGWGVGYLGNGATNVVFPLTMICLGFALMFGDGASSYLSLKLGEKKKEEASKGVGNGIFLSVIFSIFLCILSLLFLPQIINLFGCTDALKEYALQYGYVIAIGIPFFMIGTTLNSIIRADGNPKFAMTSMIIGAILNMILDPIFIFVFKMDVEGAAIATVISQFTTFLLNVLYLKKLKSISLTKASYTLKKNIIKRVSTLGISSFITQLSIVFVISVSNNLLVKYGVDSKYGSEIPITVIGIVMKISQILNSIIIGIAAGAQPIIGYNYGAQKKERVKETLKYVLLTSVIVSTIAFILFQTIPDKLIGIFGSGNATYIEFASLAFRTFLMLCICNGIQIPTGIFFQAIGKSGKSAVLTLSRQIIVLIPAMIILSHFFGIMGVLYAGAVADGIAFLLVVFFLSKEMKDLSTSKKGTEEISKEKINLKDTLTTPVIITINREYGSGGRYVGKLVAEALGIPLYDKNLISELSKETGLSENYIKENEEKRDFMETIHNGYYSSLDNESQLYLAEAELIQKLALEEPKSCVIVGRCADFILKDQKNILKIFIYNDLEHKIKRATTYYGLKKQKAEKEINRINKLRANHYKYYTEREWQDKTHYDLCINSDALGVEKAAEMICEIAKNK